MATNTENAGGFRCLAIEASTSRASVAVADGDRVFSEHLDETTGSSRQIFRAINRTIDKSGLQRSDLDCIAFGNGPGSFTGVRVATAATQSLAYALKLPVVAVSTLAAIAVEAGRSRGVEPVAACLDARMGEVYVAVYQFAADGTAQALLADQLADPAEFSLAAFPGVSVAGPGWLAYPELLQRNADHIATQATDIWPSAAAVAVEARELFRQGKAVDAHDALPNYIRDKVTY